MNSEKNFYNPQFTHIYIEESIKNHPKTKEILAHFPNAICISISHYKDLFYRKHQNPSAQMLSKSLILAAKETQTVYPGAPVCQGFGEKHFYYCTTAMNCLFDCDYCYLKGMYPTSHMVLFVNQEEIFHEVESYLAKHPMYLCIAYDTDLLAMEAFTGFLKDWETFTLQHPDLTIEVRTKAAPSHYFQERTPSPQIIYAFTLSPEPIISKNEHFTPSLARRLACIQEAIQLGYRTRLCFDPMIYSKTWQSDYQEMIKTVVASLDLSAIPDISVGSFRISQEYMKQMRRAFPNRAIVQFPYENDHGVYHYATDLTIQMENFLIQELAPYFSSEQIFLWKD